MKNRAFTLIEVLITVLIIGILAAISYPKYQLAVDKADFRKYQAMAQSLEAAYEEYYLMKGKAPIDFHYLSITLPSDFTSSYSSGFMNCKSNSKMFCCISNSGVDYSSLINCGKRDLSVVYVKEYFGWKYSPSIRKGICLAKVDDTRANRLCNSLGIKGTTTNTWTPAGHVNSYQKYTLK